MLEIILAIGSAITGGLSVYAATRHTLLKVVRQERDEWHAQNDRSRDELHAAKGELQSALLEVVELRERTNFDPVSQKLTLFMEEQRRFNDKSVSTMEDISKSLMVMMERFSKESEQSNTGEIRV